MIFVCRFYVLIMILVSFQIQPSCSSPGSRQEVCHKPFPPRELWPRWSLLDQPQCHPRDNVNAVKGRTLSRELLSPTSSVCIKDSGIDAPDDLTNAMTFLLHERDVTHYLTWEGNYWSLGSGAYADVHLGRMVATGECVVIKTFTDVPLRTIEREIRIHRYIEEVLPNTPHLFGILPSDRGFDNASLVYQLVLNGHTLHDWLQVDAFTSVQWLSVALQMAESLQRLHQKCVLHNDLHSNNVLLRFDDIGLHPGDCGLSRLEKRQYDKEMNMFRSWVKVKTTTLPRVTFIDFGHATYRKGKTYLGSTKSMAPCHHLAPEALEHRETTRASDVFSLGHELEHIAEMMNNSLLEDIALQCTATNPESRPPVRAVVESLRKLFLNECRQALLQDTFCLEKTAAVTSTFLPVSHDLLLRSSDVSSLSSASLIFQGKKSGLLDRKTSASYDSGCFPEMLENELFKQRLPYVPFTSDLFINNDEDNNETIFQSKHTTIFKARFRSTGNLVAVKKLNQNEDYFTVRYEAMINMYLNQTRWVPKFYGLVPLDKYDFYKLGIVQEIFADGIALDEVLRNRKPMDTIGRIRMALELTSLMHDVHSRHMLINNFRKENILCACVNDNDCSDMKVIDLDQATGCEGGIMNVEADTLAQFKYLAPEVRHNGPTSLASDVYSLCVILNDVLDKQVILNITTQENRDEVLQFLTKWGAFSTICFSHDPQLRPSTFQLKHFFSTSMSKL